MAMRLQDAIDVALKNTLPYGTRAEVKISMHGDSDPSGVVWYGIAGAEFVPNLPPLPVMGTTGSISGTATATTTGIAGWFTKQPAPGFSTRVVQPSAGTNHFLSSESFDVDSFGRVQPFDFAKPIPINFTVRLDPGSPFLAWLRGPSVQVEIQILSAIGGTLVNSVTLNMSEDGPILNAVGPSLEDAARRAYYEVTLSATATIG